ncbi:hypothetical protein ACP4OV_015212 [Aristida adscensionis]
MMGSAHLQVCRMLWMLCRLKTKCAGGLPLGYTGSQYIDSAVASGQAVSIRVAADRRAFYNCQFLGWQCNYDFIFGDSSALLEHCHIHCKSTGYITAHGRKSSSESTGFVFFKKPSKMIIHSHAAYMYLGRPWEPFGRVVFAETFMDQCIDPAGWHNWDNPENEDCLLL